MPDSSYASLFTRIRDHCRQWEWYGPDMLGPNALFPLYDSRLATRHARSKFLYPPATEEQLRETEVTLGFSLPAGLRALYAEVANGGFGPGYGIIGAKGGAPHYDGWYQDIIEGYLSQPPNVRWVDFAEYPPAREMGKWFELRYEDGHENLDDDWYEHPRYLIPFCYWGCTVDHQIHAITGEIYTRDTFSYALWAPSLEVWLEQWLDGTLKQE